EEWMSVRIARVQWQLVERPRPGERQPAGWAKIAEQYIRNALPFRARQPGRNQRVGMVDNVVDQYWSTGNKQYDRRNSEVTDVFDRFPVALGKRQIIAVALALGVRRLANHDDAQVRALAARAIRRERNFGVRRHGAANAL